MLGDDAICVDVRTADSLVGTVLGKCGILDLDRARPSGRASGLRRWTRSPVRATHCSEPRNNAPIERLGRTIPVRGDRDRHPGARAHDSVGVPRCPSAGAPVPLTESQRRAVWAVARRTPTALAEAGYQTWEQARSTAARLAAAEEPGVPTYDAVIVDEAQDLDPSALRLLVEVCAEPNRLFVTADVNQSIHAAGFSWKSVHDDLRFLGRTGVLKANHRSTSEITEAARDYLACGVPEDMKPDEQTYVHNGPACHAVSSHRRGGSGTRRPVPAGRDPRVPAHDRLRSGARSRQVGREPLAEALEERGIPAVYANSRDFELDDNSVSVLPLAAAKGLEFPVVAVAGFGRSKWPYIEDGSDPEADVEALVKARRTMFVAMTRAMRALLVVTPIDDDSMLYDGFDPALWNVST